MSEPFIAQITIFAGNFAPKNWAFCDGQIMSIAQNSALFSLLGTTFGGNGTTTFGLPDLRGRAPIQPGQGPGLSNYALGEMGGTETNTLLITNLPGHNHSLSGTSTSADQASPSGNTLATEPTGSTAFYKTANPNVQMAPLSIGVTGGSQPMNNLQPYLAINYIIALYGIFPSRS